MKLELSKGDIKVGLRTPKDGWGAGGTKGHICRLWELESFATA